MKIIETQIFRWKTTKRCQKSTCRSSRSEMICRKSVFRNFAKFTGKQLCQSLFFNKVANLRQIFAKFLEQIIEHLRLQNISGGCFCACRRCECSGCREKTLLLRSSLPLIEILLNHFFRLHICNNHTKLKFHMDS